MIMSQNSKLIYDENESSQTMARVEDVITLKQTDNILILISITLLLTHHVTIMCLSLMIPL